MTDTIRDLIAELDAFEKSASAMDGIDSLPGSENDKPIPSGATSSDPKVKDDTIDNTAHQSTSGAKADGDVPASNANKYEADEPVLNADKKPLDSADANAKEASSKGNDLVDFILNAKQAQANATATEQATLAPGKAVKQASPAPAAETITLDMALMAKIAAITLADEEGQWAVQQALTKRAGAEFAEEILDLLEKRAQEEQAAADYAQGAADAEAMLGDMEEAQGAADAEAMIGGMEEAQGAADAEALLANASEEDLEAASAEAMTRTLEDYSTEEIAEAVSELAAEGQIPEDQASELLATLSEDSDGATADGEVTEEDLAEAIVEAVESGELTEEDAQALVQAIAEESAVSETTDQALAEDVAGAAASEAAEAEKAASARASFKQQLVDVLRRGH